MAYATRITPAFAGSTKRFRESFPEYEDHPRLRGEHHLFRATRGFLTGSPPPSRGAHKENYKVFVCIGITPAFAGSTSILYFCKS